MLRPKQRTELKEEDIAIFYNVVLALCQDLALGLHTSLVSLFPQDAVVVDDSLDESFLKICMNF